MYTLAQSCYRAWSLHVPDARLNCTFTHSSYNCCRSAAAQRSTCRGIAAIKRNNAARRSNSKARDVYERGSVLQAVFRSLALMSFIYATPKPPKRQSYPRRRPVS